MKSPAATSTLRTSASSAFVSMTRPACSPSSSAATYSANVGDIAGFELEAWLVDGNGDPLPENERFLNHLNNPLVVPELANYNVELNGSPTALSGRAFSRLHDELSATWQACQAAADDLGCQLVTIGILPTIKDAMLNSAHMSHMVRYQALNDRVMALRDGKPLEVRIEV